MSSLVVKTSVRHNDIGYPESESCINLRHIIDVRRQQRDDGEYFRMTDVIGREITISPSAIAEYAKRRRRRDGFSDDMSDSSVAALSIFALIEGLSLVQVCGEINVLDE